eukprot:TRINITY_DN749_c0_g2_i1.p1 TRINITY_DN749_c0_g2~~TRINITY_DN749_c0_g2_i1.p1  ORF type:complete len:319 (+),score=47.88 TRINITY_DN749_c0_g2_i1:16-972(+)
MGDDEAAEAAEELRCKLEGTGYDRLLLPLFDGGGCCRVSTAGEEERRGAGLSPLFCTAADGDDERPWVKTLAQFERNFDAFTSGQLACVNWDNMVVAGGCILACLEDTAVRTTNEDVDTVDWEFYDQLHAHPQSDIDVFFYGLTPQEATLKVLELHEKLWRTAAAFGVDPLVHDLVVRTTNTITWARGYPLRNVQLMLHCYKSKAEVICGFDVDCCAVCYDGRQVYAIPRSLRSICTHWNVLSPHCLTYSASRVRKYAARGFRTSRPNFLFPDVTYDDKVLMGLPKQELFLYFGYRAVADSLLLPHLKVDRPYRCSHP